MHDSVFESGVPVRFAGKVLVSHVLLVDISGSHHISIRMYVSFSGLNTVKQCGYSYCISKYYIHHL